MTAVTDRQAAAYEWCNVHCSCPEFGGEYGSRRTDLYRHIVTRHPRSVAVVNRFAAKIRADGGCLA